jgi:hypothetical protein
MIALCSDGSRWEAERMREARADGLIPGSADSTPESGGASVPKSGGDGISAGGAGTSAAAEAAAARGAPATGAVDLLKDPPSLELFACQAANYSAKYLTKNAEETQFTQKYMMKVMNCRRVDGFECTTDAALEGKQLVTKLVNMISVSFIFPATLAAQFMLKQTDNYSTHKVAAYYPNSFVARMRDELAPHVVLRTASNKEMAQPVNLGDNVEYVSLVTDYKYRSEYLWMIPAYLYIMYFEKVTGREATRRQQAEQADADDDAGAANGADDGAQDDAAVARRGGPQARYRYEFQPDHPQALLGHAAVIRTTWHLPQAISTFAAAPPADAPHSQRELLALTVLSLFMSDMLQDLVRKLACSLLDIFDAWRSDAVDFGVLYASPDAMGAAARDVVAGLPLKNVLLKLKQQFDSERREVPKYFIKLHAKGREIVANIDSLASAQEEDRHMAKCLRRQMRRAVYAYCIVKVSPGQV